MLLLLLFLGARFGGIKHGRLHDLFADGVEGGLHLLEEFVEALVDDFGDAQGLEIGEQAAGGAGGIGFGAGAGFAQNAAEKIVDLGDAVVERAREGIREDEELGGLPR